MMKCTLLTYSLLALSLVGIAGALAIPARAQTSVTPPIRSITVIGVGKATGTPDIARIVLGVDSVKPTLNPAVTEVNKKTNDILAALKKAGIADKDLQTANFSIFPQQDYGPNGPGQITAYRVSNTVRVTVRDVSKASSILEQAINAGANNVQGLTFDIDDPKPLETEARVNAVADAKFKADALATEAGATVGRVFSISEVITGGPIPLPVPAAAEARVGGGGVSVEPGSQDVTVQIQITYELE